MTNDPFVCTKCFGQAEYAGRIGLPSKVICRCKACGHENWVTYRPDAAVTQQQQPQKKPQ